MSHWMGWEPSRHISYFITFLITMIKYWKRRHLRDYRFILAFRFVWEVGVEQQSITVAKV